MVNRFGRWWQLWMMLGVVWTFIVATSAWLNLPRAQYMPHDPQFASKLSDEAAAILRRADVNEKVARGALIWVASPRIVRMPNGTDLTFPAVTTGGQVALVAGEYVRLLRDAANERRVLYLLEMLALWLAPGLCLLIAVPAARLFFATNGLSRVRTLAGGYAPSVTGNSARSAVAISESRYANDGDIMASRATHPGLAAF
jgi:hypothetical protein